MRFLKGISIWGILVVVMLYACSCEKEAEVVGGVAKLNLSVYDINLQNNDKESVAFTLTSTRDWTATCTQPWVAISQTSGKASKEAVDMVVYVTRNSGATREASIYFTNNRMTKVMTIVQPGGNQL